MTDFSIEPLAEDALLLRLGDAIDLAINVDVHAAAHALRAAALPGVTDIAPAYASLLVRFDPAVWERADRESSLPDRLLQIVHGRAEPAGTQPRNPGIGRDEQQAARHAASADAATEVPVCYGGAFGPDLEAVAAHAGLSPDAVIARHTAGEYSVAMLGFAPGFPYLLGLDPALQVPRRADPRTRVPAGSVAIGGAQTGIYPRELPGGWNLIGRTPLVLFDPERNPACLLAPGDRVRFRAIDADEFARLTGHSA